MPLIKAQCTNCGGNLTVDNSKDAAICPFCNTPFVIEKAVTLYNINNANINLDNANININNRLDADTMFENWLVTKDERLKRDFRYYYATDPRIHYMNLITKKNGIIELDLSDKGNFSFNYLRSILLNDERFKKYYDTEYRLVKGLFEDLLAEYEERRKQNRKARINAKLYRFKEEYLPVVLYFLLMAGLTIWIWGDRIIENLKHLFSPIINIFF